MDFILPDWAPNVHPLLVHFPVALLIAAALIDIVALLAGRRRSLGHMATILYVLGALGALVSWLSGRAAADSVAASGAASAILTDHADWATITLWFFGVYALLRVGLWKLQFRTVLWTPMVVLGAVGLVLVFQSASLGGRLVFEQGVGVQKVIELEAELAVQARELAKFQGQSEAPVVESNGSWSWMPGPYAPNAFFEAFEVQMGELEAETATAADGLPLLALTVARGPALVVFDTSFASVEFNMLLDGRSFDGVVRLVHHLQDTLTYHYVELADGFMRQGQMEKGSAEVMEEASLEFGGPLELRVSGDRGHFRGYAGGRNMTHGHGPSPPPGPVGLYINGSGTLLVGPMRAAALR